MSYWQGKGSAPGYSREVEGALTAVRAAEAELLATMQRAYPKNSVVRVVHYRGQFFATVLGHDPVGARICVRNNHTGKASAMTLRRRATGQLGDPSTAEAWVKEFRDAKRAERAGIA